MESMTTTPADIAHRIKRSANQRWTSAEIDILIRDFHAGLTPEQSAANLPRRNPHSIALQRRDIGLFAQPPRPLLPLRPCVERASKRKCALSESGELNRVQAARANDKFMAALAGEQRGG